MSINHEAVRSVHHWNDTLFSFTTTRSSILRFKSGQFVMIGLEVAGRPLMRAYSIVSAHYDDHLEFYSIKVPDGPLTSRLQHLQSGDTVLVSRKPTGTLILDHLRPGKNLYLLATGTGLAPFMSVIRDPDAYEAFDRIVLVHGVRFVSELGYHRYIASTLPEDELLGSMVREKLIYHPTVTREPFTNRGRLSDLIAHGNLFASIGMPSFDPDHDRIMICGSPAMLTDMAAFLECRGFTEGAGHQPGEYVIERAFVER